MKVENWNSHEIRFVFTDDEWWAVAKDIAKALGYRNAPDMSRMLDEDEKSSTQIVRSTKGGNPNVTIISETGIYEAIFNSRRAEAKEFKKWVKQVVKKLREAVGLEQHEILQLISPEKQKEAMAIVSKIKDVSKKDYIKANTIANKVTSTKHGFKKMIKKGEMTPDMLVDRQLILDDTVNLMHTNDEFRLGLSISKSVKSKWNQ